MLWIKALHIIFMVTWFSGIFYLPRLYVYHAMSEDRTSIERFKIMERKLYYGIMMPGAILTTMFGIWLLTYNLPLYLSSHWMQVKLLLVLILWAYHLYLGYLRKVFQRDNNQHSHIFYRWLNEFPVILLIGIILLVTVKPLF